MSPSAPVEAVMFDMDGTLVDSRAAIVHAYEDSSVRVLGRGLDVDESEFEEILKLRGSEAFPRLLDTHDPELLVAFTEAFHEAYARRQDEIPAFPGVADALRRLADMGVALGIATSKARVRVDSHLERLGLLELFGCIVTGDDVAHPKPSPDPIRAVADGLGVPVAHGLYVGDGENDVKAARAAGMRAVGVAFGFHPEDCLAEEPEFFVESYAGLVELVASLRGAPTQA